MDSYLVSLVDLHTCANPYAFDCNYYLYDYLIEVNDTSGFTNNIYNN